jgi:hypothetical protein
MPLFIAIYQLDAVLILFPLGFFFFGESRERSFFLSFQGSLFFLLDEK